MIGKVFYNAGSQVVGKVFTATTTLIVTLFIGKALGPTGFGEFTKIFVFVGYFYTISDFGLNSIFVKKAEAKSAVNLLKTLVGLRLIAALLLALVAISIVFFLPYDVGAGTGFGPTVKLGITIASMTIVTQALYTTANAFFQKNLRYDLSTVAAIAQALVIFLVIIFVSRSATSPIPYVFAYVLGGLFLVLVAYWLIYRESGRVVLPQFSPSESLGLISLAWPVGLALIFNLIYFRIDVFILANTRPSSEVGLYGLAYQFFEASLAVPIFFANAVYPLLTQIYRRNITNFKKQLRTWVSLMSLFSAGLLILLFLISYLIPYIYDWRFAPSKGALQILAIGLPFFFISALLWHVLIIYGKQKYLIYIYGFGAIFNLGANLILIPMYGYLAAAATTVVSEALIMLLLAVVSFKISRATESGLKIND